MRHEHKKIGAAAGRTAAREKDRADQDRDLRELRERMRLALYLARGEY